MIQGYEAHEGLLQIVTAAETIGFEHISDTPIESLNHAIGSGRAWLGKTMLDT